MSLIFYLITPLLVGFLGAIFTTKAIPIWYSNLNKPFFSPPNWLFAPVWTILYLMMGYASFLVFQSKLNLTSKALRYYWLQLVLNFFWSVIFFGLKNPALAFLEIIVLWVTIYKTKKLFLKISKVAGYLFVPYLLWVSFASILNFSIVLLN